MVPLPAAARQGGWWLARRSVGRYILTMRTRLSICRKKRRFVSEAEAIAAAQTASIALRPYRCDRCFRYHLTGRTRGKRRLPVSG